MARHAGLLVMLLVAAAVRANDLPVNAVLDACAQPGDARLRGDCHFLLGLRDIDSGNDSAARLHLDEAARSLEAAHDPVGAWKAYWVLAQYETRFGRRANFIIASHESALAVLKRAEESQAPLSLQSLQELGDMLGRPLTYWPTFAKSLFLQLFQAVTTNGYAAALIAAGELEQAETQLRIASRLAEPFGAMLDRSIARNVGLLRRRQSRLAEAKESYLKALAAPRAAVPFTVDDRGEGDIAALSALADIEILGGRIDEALRWSDLSLAIARAANERAAEVELLGYRAELLERGGRFVAAEHVYAQGLALAEQNRDVKGQAVLLAGRAAMYGNRGRYGASVADSEKSLALLSTIDQPWLQSTYLTLLAGTYSGFGADASAALALQEARNVVDKSRFWIGQALLDLIAAVKSGTQADVEHALERWSELSEVRGMENTTQIIDLLRAVAGAGQSSVGQGAGFPSGSELESLAQTFEILTLLENGQPAESREKAMGVVARSADPELRTNLFSMIAVTYALEGNVDKAIDYFYKAIDELDVVMKAVGTDDLLSGILGENRTQFDALIELLCAANRSKEAFEVSERARSRAFLWLIGNRRVRPPSGEQNPIAQELEALGAQIAQLQQQARVAPSKTIDEGLRGARRRYQALLPRVKASQSDAGRTSVQPLRVDAVHQELAADTTLISYYTTSNGIDAWVLDRTMLQYVRLPFDRTALASAECAVKRFHAAVRSAAPDAPCRAATSEELYRWLFAPLRSNVRNRRLIIVPHGLLHYLAFGAFRDPRTKRFLIEDYTITYAPSASSIAFLRDKETPVYGKSLVIGAPAGVSPELPGAMREAIMVAAKLRSRPMVGSAAKESLLYGLDGKIDLIHIAAHAFYDADTPLFSHVALAAGDGNDGNLEVHEILSDVDLTGVNLVVLSACKTAIGKISGGDEIAGLTRALLYAGTPGVISTLWSIDDDAAAELMRHFYDRLLGGDSVAEALRGAQLQLLHGKYPDPGQWAAFIVNGDPEGRWNGSGPGH